MVIHDLHCPLQNAQLQSRSLLSATVACSFFEIPYPCSPNPFVALQSLQIPGFFLLVPSPLHGTSASTRSK